MELLDLGNFGGAGKGGLSTSSVSKAYKRFCFVHQTVCHCIVSTLRFGIDVPNRLFLVPKFACQGIVIDFFAT